MADYRSRLYGLLARVYSSEPDKLLIEMVKAQPFKDAFSELGVELESDFTDRPEELLLEELAVEFSRLFLGPGPHISPHESVHHEIQEGKRGLLWGDSTVEVKRFIESTGLAIESDFNLIPDHISVELEFMQLLTKEEAKAREEGDADGANRYLDMEREFLDRHVLAWVPSFCDKVMSTAQSGFYRGMARLTKGFLEYETENMIKSAARG